MEFQKVTFRVIHDIKWDNWGHFVTAFRKGDVVEGDLYEDGDICAESPYYKGTYDWIDTECIEILK